MFRILSAPKFKDPEKTRKALMFRNYMLGIIISVTLLEMSLVIFLNSDITRSAYITITCDIICILLIYLNRIGFYRTASITYLLLSILTVLAFTWITGGMDSFVALALPVTVLMGGLMLGWKAVISVGLFSIGGSLAIAALQFYGHMPPAVIYYNPLMKWAIISCLIGILVFIQYFTLSYLNRSLQKTKKELSLRIQAETQLRESEKRYRLIAENTSDVIWTLDLTTGKFSYVSPSIEKLRGYTPEEVMGQTMADALTPESLQKASRMLEEAIQSQKPGDTTPQKKVLEVNEICKDGSIIDTEISATMVFNDQSLPAELIGVTREVTERKKAEEALRESEEKYRTIVEMTDEWIWEMDLDLKHTYSNQRILKILGYSLKEFLGKSISSFIHPDDMREEMIMLPQFINEKKGWQGRIVRWRHKNGEYRYLESNASPVLNDRGELAGFRGTDRDITERKLAEQALLESEQRYKLVTELTSDYVYRLNVAPDGTVTMNFISDNYYTITGRDKKDAATVESWSSIIHPDDIGRIIALLTELIAEPKTAELECRSYVHGRQLRWVHVIARSEWDEKEQRVTSITGSVKDITEQKLAEDALQQSEVRYRSLFESAQDAILLIKDVYFIDCNPSALAMFNCTMQHITGKTPIDFSPEFQPDGQRSNEKIQNILHLLEKGAVEPFEWRHIRQDETTFDTEVSLSKIILNNEHLFQAMVRDITERKIAEDKLKTSLREKETLLRELYHRTKNNMQVISAMVNLSADKLHDPESLTVFKDIDSKIHTMSLVHKKLYESQDLSHINLKDYLNELTSYLSSFYMPMTENIEILVKGEDIFLIIDMAIPLGMVLNELITNSMKYAFPNSKKGSIEINLNKDNETITIIVSDNGIGLSDKFTITENASLGLQTATTIITLQLQGEMQFDTQPDRGTTWTITFRTDLYEKRV